MNLRSGEGLRAHGRAAAEPSGPKEARGREPDHGEEVPRHREAGGQLEHEDRKNGSDDLDEAHFGVHEEIVLARGFLNNAQWTGVATGERRLSRSPRAYLSAQPSQSVP